MKPQFLLTALTVNMVLAFSAHATDAGTILREVATQPTVAPATITPLTAQTGDISTDTTPISVSDVVLVGNTLLSADKVEPHLASIRGTSTTFGGLQSLARTISDEYHKAGYPLATVIIPPQRLENGVVVLQVIEGKIANVNVQNQSRLSDAVAEKYLTRAVQPNAPLKQADSERALLLIKDLAGTEGVSYRLAEGEQGTNLVVDLDKALLVDGFVQLDNYGSKSTGEWRTRAGVNLNSPFGRGERISVQGMSSFQGVDYAKVSADIPVGYDGLTVIAGAGHTRYDLGGAFKDLNATGTADTVDVGVRYPVLRSNTHSVWLNTNAEYRDLQDIIGATNTVTDKSLRAVQLGLNGYHQDSLGMGGYTQWSVNNTFGNLDIKSSDAKAVDSASAKTDGNYYKLTGSIGRTQYITPKFSIYAGANGQWANQNLDSAEQMSLGGADGVAAYHSNDVSADMAVIGQVEFRYAATPSLSINAFYDAGRAKLRHTPFTDTPNFVDLYGGGFGFGLQRNGWFLQSKLAWQGSDITFSQNRDPRFWLKAGYQF